MAISALSFDADQTLWDFDNVRHQALSATAAAMVERGDIGADSVSAEQLQAVRAEVVTSFRGEPHTLEDVRERSFAVFLERAGHDSPDRAAAELLGIFLRVRFDAIKLFPEVRSSLGRLKRLYKLGLLSNGNTYPDRCGLPNTFDAEVLGPAHGFEKPDPRAFKLIADLLGVGFESLVHVGDDWDDVQGANDVGAISVFLNRTGADPKFRRQAAYEVTTLVELEELLVTLSGDST